MRTSRITDLHLSCEHNPIKCKRGLPAPGPGAMYPRSLRAIEMRDAPASRLAFEKGLRLPSDEEHAIYIQIISRDHEQVRGTRVKQS